MHPAPSLIVFTVLSGLGFGFLTWIGLGQPAVTGRLALMMLALAYLLAIAGLAASVFHLGNPQRAGRAFTQWRTSWLSREAWVAIFALAVLALYGIGLVFFEIRWTLLGWLGSALSLVVVYCTSMIYCQLKTVPRWNHWSTPVLFLCFSIAGGALLADRVMAAWILLVMLAAVQYVVWRHGDRRFAAAGHTAETATGLGNIGRVRLLEPPHTGPNYLLDEMVFRVGRKHAVKLRRIALVLTALAPALLLTILPTGHVSAGAAAILHVMGALLARWLFFAEAEHVVGLYYGAHRQI
ncbi:MAG: DmsC/YnfH family molybdoenzyme membrane anchor subunit [Pseudomonadota bacterium]